MEAEATAKIFGRFAVPLVCAFQLEGDPDSQYGKVCRFGWKTLVDDNALLSVLNVALQEKRS